nr:MAG TPA: hypothetical protein [Inoviridae sp.]
MRKLLKRFAAAASAVVIGGVSCVTAWFSVPVSAAGGVGMLEWLEFQTLLQGIGIGGSNDDFVKSVDNWTKSIGGPEMPREDYDGEWMTNYEYYNRLGWDEIIGFFDNLLDDFDSVGDVGSWSPSGGWICDGWKTASGMASFSSVVDYPTIDGEGYFSIYPYNKIFDNPFVVARIKSIYDATDEGLALFTMPAGTTFYRSTKWYSNDDKNRCAWGSRNGYQLLDYTQSSGSLYLLSSLPYSFSPWSSCIITKDDYYKLCSDWGLNTVYDSFSSALVAIAKADWKPGSTGSDAFIGPVYTYPAAQDLYKSTGTAAGIRLDVQTQDGVPDIQAALDGAGVDTVDDLVAGVAAGTVPMSKVFTDAKVTPYVVADTATGAVVTDLGVSATATGVKSVGLTQDLAVPKDLTNAAAYTVKGKTWDPEMSKYKLPLFQYFPFCLPWDIYQVLAAFSADPVAPVFDVPVGKILSGVRSADVSKAASVSAKIDFGDDNWSKVFEIIRILECAGIIVGLCLVAVYLIHGGR